MLNKMYRAKTLMPHLRRHGRDLVTDLNQAHKVLSMEDLPHPRELPVFGTKLALLAAGNGTRLHTYIDNRHMQLGPIFRDKVGGDTDLVFISDPAHMKSLFLSLEGKYPAHILPEPWMLYEKLYGSKRGLFFMNGEEWLNTRRIMNKHLLREDSEKWLGEPIKETISKFIQTWKQKAAESSFVPDLESDFYKLSTNVIINVLLGGNAELNPSKYYDDLLSKFSASVKKIFVTTTKLHGCPLNWCQRLKLKVWTEFKESVDTSLMLAQKLVIEMLNNKEKNTGLIRRLCEDGTSDETITRVVADFVIAAGDTTAYTTLWALYLLSENSAVTKELRTNNHNVRNAIKESMRLYPVAPFLTRILSNDCYLGSYKLKTGTPVIASIYTSGRDEKNFSKANEFLPYRWDRNDMRRKELVNHVPMASLPFALGARSCIGKKIAMIQLTEILKQILNEFEFTNMKSEKVEAITSQILVPNASLKLKFKLRQQ